MMASTLAKDLTMPSLVFLWILIGRDDVLIMNTSTFSVSEG